MEEGHLGLGSSQAHQWSVLGGEVCETAPHPSASTRYGGGQRSWGREREQLEELWQGQLSQL